jgi:uncharacterized repeat protein (TIGR03803 family)
MKTEMIWKRRVAGCGTFELSAAISGVMLLMLTTPGAAVEREVLRGHVPEVVGRLNLRPVGRLPATNRLNLAIGLSLRNTNSLSKLLQDIYEPTSPQFRRYLTPEQFTEQFGPTREEYEAVRQFARKYGLEITATHSNRVLVDVAGQVGDIEKAFRVTLRTYQHPSEPRRFFAPDVEPSVEGGLAVLDISGLDNYSIPRSAWHRSSAKTAVSGGSGSGQSGNFMGKDLRNAYAPGVTQTGAGQMVGLLAFEAFYASDITAYEKMAGLPNVPIQVVLLDGFDGINSDTSGVGGEADLDIDMVISMAPGLSNVVVFDAGPNGIPNDVLAAMAEHPQIKQFSSSWIGFSQSATSDSLFEQMAAQGQSFFEISGDGDTWFSNVLLPAWFGGTFWPADDPYVTSVGGTSLTMNGSGDSYSSEKVWNDGNEPPGWYGSAYVGSGGGISPIYPIPSWQQGLDMSANRGSKTRRSFPDVAMVAENFVVVWAGLTNTGWGGTSFAAPLWAGFMALVNQAAADNGQSPVGFLNPALYALGQSAGYTNNLHDITVGNNATDTSGGMSPAVAGYDLCTGWGSPMGSNLIYSLALPQRLGIASASLPQMTGSVGGPIHPGVLSYSLTSRSGSLDWSLALDTAWLTVAPTSGTLQAGDAATAIAVTPNLLASNLAAGSYTATLYFINLTEESVQSREVTLAIVGPPVITSQPTNQTVLAGMMATFAVGTATNALLSYQWQFDNGSGLTNLTDGGGISGSATSTLTVGSVSQGEVGSYSVIISNAAGAITSSRASLTIITGQAPVILSEPASQALLPGATADLVASVVGDPPLSYFWKRNGTSLVDGGTLSGSATGTLIIRGVTVADSGSYSVLVTNSFGSVASAVAVLNLTGVTTSGALLETLYSFTTNSLGCLPFGGLIQANNGSFYGTASGGGHQGVGTVFQMDTNGVVTLVYGFPNGSGGNNPPNGAFPYATLVQGTNGLLYGTTSFGGATDDGMVYRMSTNAASVTAWSLTFASSGSVPYGGLVQGLDGNYYGTAQTGGPYPGGILGGYGTVFKLTDSGSLTPLQSFSYGDGQYPNSTLLQGSDGALYGTAWGGGTNGGWGTIFKITPGGILTPMFSFGNTNGAGPTSGLTRDSYGTFYGTTSSGGTNNAGTVFRLTADGTFTCLYSFTGGNDGSNCWGGLLLASDGNLYGTTATGGAYGLGTVFRISPDGTLASLVQFDGDQGANPYCTLIQGTDGRLYGTTQNGGANGWGAIFRITIDSPLQITQQPRPQQAFAGDTAIFSVATFGSLPISYQWLKNGTSLSDGGDVFGSQSRTLTLSNVSIADAAMYSVVVSNTSGTVASTGARLEVISSPLYLTSGPAAQTVLVGATVTFSATASGDGPLSFQWQQNGTNLIDGGNLSGSATPTLTLASVITANSGTYSVLVSNTLNTVSSPSAMLTVLPVTPPEASLSVLRVFNGGTLPFNPHAGLVQGRDGGLYGTTLHGGSALGGIAFKVYPGGVLYLLHSFTNGADGATPLAGLTQARDGNFYGASLLGASPSFGKIFRMTPTGALTPLYGFGGREDGGNPLASLVQGGDGNLYGTASTGGTNNAGAVFSLSTNGLFTPLWSFNSTNGCYPAGPLVLGRDGRFYGTTSAGGINDMGTVFSLSTNRVFNSLFSFDSTLGAYPSNGLVQATDGSFYGTASSGGTNGGWGTVFRMTSDGTLSTLHSFSYQDGAYPVGGLVQATDGNLYGTTSQGGIGGQGTVFQITTNGLLTTLVWFNGTNGANPQSSLIQASDGSFYGTTEFGHTGYAGFLGSGDGLVFRLILPLFLSNPLSQASATATLPYSTSLSTNAVTPVGDSLSFAKVSGPAWLNVGGDGALSGTPGFSDLGTNLFIVSLTDTNGWSSTATLRIDVVVNPVITVGLSNQGTNILLSWRGRQPPYQVQVATDLANPDWQNLASPTTNTTLLVTPSTAAAFYRVQGQ